MSRPLPRGRHGLTREFVERDQRERLLAAIAATLCEHGYDETTVSLIGGVASVIGREVLAGRTEQLEEIFPEVAEFALAPYLGMAEARRIISAR
jgi:hypothetical protein